MLPLMYLINRVLIVAIAMMRKQRDCPVPLPQRADHIVKPIECVRSYSVPPNAEAEIL